MLVLGGIALVGLGALLSFVFIKNGSPKDIVLDPTPEPTEQTPSVLTAVPMQTEKKTEKYYSIDLEYPQSSATSLPEVYEYVRQVKSEFTQSIPKTDAEAEFQNVSATGGESAYQMKIHTTVYTSPTTITYKLETYRYTGGAHGGTFVATFTYDAQGKFLDLNDILLAPDALGTLSSKARSYFYAKLGASGNKETVDMGTEAKIDNFSSWYITNGGITFVFQQYQIGPYVLGLQEFPLNSTEAKKLFKY